MQLSKVISNGNIIASIRPSRARNHQLRALYLLLLCYPHHLHQQRLLLDIKNSRRGLITLRVLHLESYGVVNINNKMTGLKHVLVKLCLNDV